MKAAVTLATAVERDARPVLVHCSDGWDRTPQIVALAELLLDPFYRTVDVCIVFKNQLLMFLFYLNLRQFLLITFLSLIYIIHSSKLFTYLYCYNFFKGFRILIEREWLAFGHKFADRCGHATGSKDQNERCPVFLQWLDCVHQLLIQFPCAFQFSHTYLVLISISFLLL